MKNFNRFQKVVTEWADMGESQYEFGNMGSTCGTD